MSKATTSKTASVKTVPKATTDYPHLLDRVKTAFTLPDSEREMLAFRDKFIPYTAATAILLEMEDLLRQPPKTRPSNLLIVAPPNNGKTALSKEFTNRYPRVKKADLVSDEVPVVSIDAPGEGVERRIYSQILNAIGADYPKGSRPEELFHQIVTAFRTLGVKLLIIDEVQGILKGRADRAAIALHTLKLLGNATKVPIVGLGTERAENQMSSDDEIASRFNVVHLPKWKNDDLYKRLLSSYAQILPLKKESDLTDHDIAALILIKAKFLLGGIDRVLAEATQMAIRSGTEQITKDIVSKVVV